MLFAKTVPTPCGVHDNELVWWVQLVSKTKVHTLFTTPHSDDPMWKAVRKALNPAFSPDAIRRVYLLAIMTGRLSQAKFHSSSDLMLV